MHKSNNRLDQDLALCEKHKVPMMITSLGAREELNQAAHGWGVHRLPRRDQPEVRAQGDREGRRRLDPGFGRRRRPCRHDFAARFRRGDTCGFDGPIALSGAIANGRATRAARNSAPTLPISAPPSSRPREANAVEGYKQMITSSSAEDIVDSNLFTGVHGNYLKPSIVKAGLNPDELPTSDPSKMSFGTDASGERNKPKAWKEIWGSGQVIGGLGKVLPAAELIARFKKEYDEAVDPALCGLFLFPSPLGWRGWLRGGRWPPSLNADVFAFGYGAG